MIAGLGIATGYTAHTGQPFSVLRERLDAVAAVGFSHAELHAPGLGVIIGGRLHEGRLAALQAALADCPVRLTLHATNVATPYAGNLVDVTTPAQRAVVEADLALAAAIGAEVLVQHAGMLREPYGDDRALAAGMAAERDALRRLGDVAGEHGVRIAVENRDPNERYIVRRVYGMDLRRLGEQIAATDHPQVGICFDTGHAFLSATYLGFDYLPAVRDIAPLINHLHLSDNLGQVQLNIEANAGENLVLGDGDLHLPPGWGAVPFAAIFALPMPREPVAVIEMRATFAPHLAEIHAATRALIGGAGAGA